MKRIILLFMLLTLTACLPSDKGAPTAPQTSEVLPTPTPLPPTEAPTPTPEKITLSRTFGIAPEIAASFKGAEKYITRAENGKYQVSAKARDPQSGQLKSVTLELLPDSFSLNQDLKNDLAPATVRGLDEHGQEVTLIWSKNTAEFRLAYTFPTLFEGVGTENPRLIEENLDSTPFIPIEDIQSGLAAQSVLLAMQEDGYQPFTEEVIKWYQELGGSSLLFVQNPDGSKIVWLKPKANDKGEKNNYFNSAEMFTPYWFRTKIGDQIYDIASIAWFDPLDAQNPKADEFKILFGIPFSDYPMSAAEMTNAYATRHTFLPMWFQIYGENLNADNPKQTLLSQLLSIEGNDARLADNYDNLFERTINRRIFQLSDSNNIIEIPLSGSDYHFLLPSQLQLMIFLFEVGEAQ